MKLIITLVVVVACCGVMTEAFFSHKDKTKPCDPNPCKNAGQCVQESIDKTKFTCLCNDKFHGDKCEKANGCSKDPCPKGVTCTNDNIDKSKFHCKCPAGLLGDKCKIKDECPKTECENGKCFNNQKDKPECKCNPGWRLGFRGKCNHRECSIVEFKGKNWVTKGAAKTLVDKDIIKKCQDLDALAKLCGVKVNVLNSFMLELTNKHHADPKQYNMYIGRGLQFQIHDTKDKLICNDVCIEKHLKGKASIREPKCLIDGMPAIGWKVSHLHPGYVTDGSEVAFSMDKSNNYNILKESHQTGCKDGKYDTA